MSVFAKSKCVFNAMENIQENHPYLSQRDTLDMSVLWCEKRQSDFSNDIEFDCQEYQDLVHPIAEEVIYLEATIDHCGWIVEDIEDFITQDVSKKPKKKTNTEAMQAGKAKKKEVGQRLKKGKEAKKTKQITTTGKRELSKQHPQGKEVLAKLPELFEVGSPEEYVKVMGELIPTPELSNGVTSFKGRQATPNLPMTAVGSSTVQGRAVLGNNLYVKFHSSPDKVYKYEMGSNEAAQGAFDEMVQGSPGRWVWNNLRNHKKGDPTHNPDGSKIASKYGAVFGNPSKETLGGIGASNVPYEKSSYARVKRFMNEMPGFEELAKKMSKFKMEVKAEGEGATSGEPFSQEELEKFQGKMKKEVEIRKKLLETLRKSFKTKGMKEVKRVVSQLPDRDFGNVEDSIGICEDCKKEKDLYYQKLCNKCYQKRVKHYVDKYDIVEDSINELVDWVISEGITSDRKEAKIIAYKIVNSKKSKPKSKEQPKETNWRENWAKVGEGFDKARKTKLDKWAFSKKKKEAGRPRKQGRPTDKSTFALLKRTQALKRDYLMEDIYELELQLQSQGHNIEQIRQEYEVLENG